MKKKLTYTCRAEPANGHFNLFMDISSPGTIKSTYRHMDRFSDKASALDLGERTRKEAEKGNLKVADIPAWDHIQTVNI